MNGAVPIATFEVNVLAVTVPDTPSDANVPTDVTFGCAAVANVPVNNVPLTLPALTLPDTVNEVSVPTDVICD